MDQHTFGSSPAALYLAKLLIDRNDPKLAKKVSKVLAINREVLNELGNAHLKYDVISLETFGRLLTLVSANNKSDAIISVNNIDPFIGHLVTNILEGGVKTWKRRIEVASRKQAVMARNTSPGYAAPKLLAGEIDGEKDSLLLQERSKRYLNRKGKVDTLY